MIFFSLFQVSFQKLLYFEKTSSVPEIPNSKVNFIKNRYYTLSGLKALSNSSKKNKHITHTDTRDCVYV